jgi:hypothetical protein
MIIVGIPFPENALLIKVFHLLIVFCINEFFGPPSTMTRIPSHFKDPISVPYSSNGIHRTINAIGFEYDSDYTTRLKIAINFPGCRKR